MHLYIKSLRSKKFPFGQLPSYLQDGVKFLEKQTNDRLITDNLKLQVLDLQLYSAIADLHPEHKAVRETAELIQNQQAANNQGFNTLLKALNQ